MKKINKMSLFVLAVFVSIVLIGCGSGEKPYTKEDFKKTKPPKEYRGPGQPGGPPANAATSSGVQPPSNLGGQ